MEEYQNEAWKRIEAVRQVAKVRSANSLAHIIGLSNAEGLYRIKSGKSGISKSLAKRISECFPQFEVSWLIGESKPSASHQKFETNNRLVKLPFYKDIKVRETSDYIYMPETLTKGAEIALYLKNNDFYPMLCKGLIALFRKSGEELAYVNVHVIYTARKTILCTIKHNSNSEKIACTPLGQDEEIEIRIDRNTIKEIYVNCGIYIYNENNQ